MTFKLTPSPLGSTTGSSVGSSAGAVASGAVVVSGAGVGCALHATTNKPRTRAKNNKRNLAILLSPQIEIETDFIFFIILLLFQIQNF